MSEKTLNSLPSSDKQKPVNSIIIPCRNEKKFIGKCLDSLLANEYPRDKFEILVVDGASDDDTIELVKEYQKIHYPFIRLLNNPKKITSAALNIGIREANGDYITILSSHSIVEKNFIKANISHISKNGVDCVGGILETLPANDSLYAKAIAAGLSHPFGVGNAYFRIGIKESKYVDTVPFGCYRKEIFQRIGYFDEDLVRNQDDEFNLRILKNSGKILLIPEIQSYYYARDSISKLSKMYFQYGYFKPLVAIKLGSVFTWRQIIPAAFVGSLLICGLLSLIIKPFILLLVISLFPYLIVNLFFSLSLAFKKGLKYFLIMPYIFSVIHVSYGSGYLKGILDFILLKKQKNNRINEVKLTR